MKKGFTLTEMLAVIVIIMIMGMIAAPALMNMLKNNNENSYESIVNDIALAGQSYAANKGGTLVQISVKTLQDEGYLSKKTNPIDNTTMNGCVYIVDGENFYKEETCETIIILKK